MNGKEFLKALDNIVKEKNILENNFDKNHIKIEKAHIKYLDTFF